MKPLRRDLFRPITRYAANVNVAGAPLGLDNPVDRQHVPLPHRGQKVQFAVNDHGFPAPHVSFSLLASRIPCATRLWARYSDFWHS